MVFKLGWPVEKSGNWKSGGKCWLPVSSMLELTYPFWENLNQALGWTLGPLLAFRKSSSTWTLR